MWVTVFIYQISSGDISIKTLFCSSKRGATSLGFSGHINVIRYISSKHKLAAQLGTHAEFDNIPSGGHPWPKLLV